MNDNTPNDIGIKEDSNDGPISFGLGVTPEGLVALQFSQKVLFIAFTPKEAHEFAAKLTRLAIMSELHAEAAAAQAPVEGHKMGAMGIVKVDDSNVIVIGPDGKPKSGANEATDPALLAQFGGSQNDQAS